MNGSRLLLLVFCTVTADSMGQAADDDLRIEEVIVTATKRASPLQDTSMSVGVITGSELFDAGSIKLEDYWRTIPSLAVSDQGFAGTAIAIRGLGNDFNATLESMVAVYFDEVPTSQADGLFTLSPDFNLVDIERIEVLRGPQGTLFGASAMGGALRVISNRPDPGSTSGSLDARVSATAHGGTNHDLSAMLNQPFGEASALRLVAYRSDFDGFVDDVISGERDINGRESTGLRLSVASRLGDRLSLTGRVQYQDQSLDGYAAVSPDGLPALGTGALGDYDAALLVDEFRDDEAAIYSLELDYASPWGLWTSVTAWFDYEVDADLELSQLLDYIHPINGPTRYDQEVLTQEIRIASNPESKIEWLAGAFYLDQDYPRLGQIASPGLSEAAPFLPPGLPDVVFEVAEQRERRDLGLFGEFTVPLGERFRATLGARWYDIRKRNRSTTTAILRGVLDEVQTQAHDEDGVTAKVALAWDVSDDSLAYFNAAQGFRAGGGNEPFTIALCGAPASYESDDLWSYEIGTRNTLWDRRLMLNASVYAIDWDDAQFKIDLPDCNAVFIANAGKVETEGLEVELVAQLSESWQLDLAAGYTDSALAEDTTDAPAGTKIPLVPDVTAALASSHRFPLAGGYDGFVRVDAQYTGAANSNLIPAFNVRQPSYSLINLRAGLETDRWQAILFADNLLDEQAVLAAFPDGSGFVTNRPRTVGVQVHYRF